MSLIDRRTFLTGTMASLAALSTNRSLAADPLQRAAGTQNARRIDVHHHFAPPEWMEAVKGRPLLNAANLRWTANCRSPTWTRRGVAASIVSITNPGIWFGDKEKTRVLDAHATTSARSS